MTTESFAPDAARNVLARSPLPCFACRGCRPDAIFVERGQAKLGNDVLGRQIRVERGQCEPVIVVKPDKLDSRSVLFLNRARLLGVEVDFEQSLADGKRGRRPLLVVSGRSQ